MTPINPNDHAALNAAFAEKVAGWTYETFPNGPCPDIKHWRDASGKIVSLHIEGGFTHSADAVMPWLEKHEWGAFSDDGKVRVAALPERDLFKCGMGAADTFAHAAVIALLRAHGVPVDEAHAGDSAKQTSPISGNSTQEASR